MNRMRFFTPAAIALSIVLAACGGGGGSGKEATPTKSPRPPKTTVETPRGTEVNDLAASVVMVAPGLLDDGDFEPVATGSGTIVDESGLILTNWHVVDPEGVGSYDDIAIYVTEDPKDAPELTYFGGLAAWDEDLDLAVVRITENRNGVEIDVEDLDLPVVELGDADELDIGETLTVLGYPAIGEGSLELTKGAVSGFLAVEGKKDAWIKTDARIAAGNSGGGAFSDAGELVGIPTAIYWVEELGSEESGRIRPIDLAKALIREAEATTSVVIPQIDEPDIDEVNLDVPLLSEADLSSSFVLSGESYVSNDNRASFYEDPEAALDFYEEYGRIGGVRRVFDDFDSSEAQGVTPTVVMVQVDVYETADGAAGAVNDCTEFVDTMWEFVTELGFEFYEPEYVEGAEIGEEACLFSSEEDISESQGPPLQLTFVGFRQENVLVVVGVFSLTGSFDFQTPLILAQVQSDLLLPSASSGQPTPEDAIAEYLYTYDTEYIGDCSYADLDRDVGRYCSTPYDDRDDEIVYVLGPTFSEYNLWLLTEQDRDGGWVVTDWLDVSYDSSGRLVPPPW